MTGIDLRDLEAAFTFVLVFVTRFEASLFDVCTVRRAGGVSVTRIRLLGKNASSSVDACETEVGAGFAATVSFALFSGFSVLETGGEVGGAFPDFLTGLDATLSCGGASIGTATPSNTDDSTDFTSMIVGGFAVAVETGGTPVSFSITFFGGKGPSTRDGEFEGIEFGCVAPVVSEVDRGGFGDETAGDDFCPLFSVEGEGFGRDDAGDDTCAIFPVD